MDKKALEYIINALEAETPNYFPLGFFAINCVHDMTNSEWMDLLWSFIYAIECLDYESSNTVYSALADNLKKQFKDYMED